MCSVFVHELIISTLNSEQQFLAPVVPINFSIDTADRHETLLINNCVRKYLVH